MVTVQPIELQPANLYVVVVSNSQITDSMYCSMMSGAMSEICVQLSARENHGVGVYPAQCGDGRNSAGEPVPADAELIHLRADGSAEKIHRLG
jgi:hypothetical protein